jgi:hypothetical protein
MMATAGIPPLPTKMKLLKGIRSDRSNHNEQHLTCEQGSKSLSAIVMPVGGQFRACCHGCAEVTRQAMRIAPM